MTSTTGILSFTLTVDDLDRAARFYRDTLGFEIRQDLEAWPGARFIEVVPPGSTIGLMLVPRDTELPVAVRLTTPDATEAFDELRSAGTTVHNDEVVMLGDYPPMFHFADPDGNGLVYIEEKK